MDSFKLPMNIVSLCYKSESGKVVGHSLDFDLVCVGETRDEAKAKLRLAIKAYVEYGLENELAAYIRRPAASEYWDRILTSKISGETETIQILDRRLFTTCHEVNDLAVQAV